MPGLGFQGDRCDTVRRRNSTQTQSPANSATSAKKFVAGGPADKTDTRKLKETSDPASSGANAELPVPLENVPVAPIQVYELSRPTEGDDRQLNFIASDESNRLWITWTGGVDNDAKTPNLAEATPDGRVLPSVLLRPAKRARLWSSRRPRMRLDRENSSRRRLLCPQVVQLERRMSSRPSRPLIALNRPFRKAPSSRRLLWLPLTAQNSPLIRTSQEVQEKPRVAIDALPPTAPAELNINAPANQNLESVADTNAASQSGLANPTTAAVPKNTAGRNASNSPPRIKGRDIKDSRTTPAPVGSQDSFRRDKSREDRRTQRAMGRIPPVSPFQVIPAPTPSRVL